MTTPSDCVAIIPAKGTSRRIPRKNLAMCAGQTLVERAIHCAVEAKLFQAILVSSEDVEILERVSDLMGLHSMATVYPCHRPSVLSTEGVGVAAVVSDLLARNKYRWPSFCILWPTSPLRTAGILHLCWEDFQGFPCLHTVYSDRPAKHDGTALFMHTQYFLTHLTLDLDKTDGTTFKMNPNECIDVDTPEDLAEAERRLLAREAACPSS